MLKFKEGNIKEVHPSMITLESNLNRDRDKSAPSMNASVVAL